MGSSASTLSKEQSVKLTQTLKNRYEEYKVAGMPESEIQTKLTNEYHEIVAKLKLEALTMNVNTEPAKLGKIGKAATSSSASKLPGRGSFEEGKSMTPKSNSSSKLGGLGSSKLGGGVSGKGGGTRRRSFDGNKGGGAATAAAAAATAAANAVLNKAATAAEPNTDSATAPVSPNPTSADATLMSSLACQSTDQVDSWDSITQQPFCTICQMAFKSNTFLDRHVKYSDLHIKNVQKQKNAANPSVTDIGSVDEMFPVSQSGKMEAKQVEGKHYRLLYSGSKLFWRTQETIDLNIFHHILPSTIEIVSYDTVKAKEMNRIYCDYTALCDLSGVTAAAMASAGARAAAARAAAARELEATAAQGTAAKKEKEAQTAALEAEAAAAADPTLVADETTMLARYIIQRLQLAPAGGDTTAKKMEFAKLASDDYDKSPVMEKVPVVLIPISVARRRRTNAEEIEQTMHSLANDRAALAEATSHAHKVASVMYSASTSIASKKWWSDFNPVRRKWIWAIRRVIRQKLVAETTAVLRELEQKKRRELKRALTGNISAKAKEV
eukprot:CAMPEP_0170382588 /NCGR_PEP_ID=MMETSP0117_2-20130122/15028_1 /TAXON_ID=400756 /ORGANISM="Durinskia baltica, Strain CSIRO CS-38" /LENGTH=553 /DNA_ID=CAMNT_0010638247 /DNA_START=56 /DNA_END=1717 /DNA_ORIENTATION=+